MKRLPLIPPRLAQQLLLSFLRDDLAEEVIGDLDEKFQKVATQSLVKAKVNYWYQVLNYARPFAIRKFHRSSINHIAMFENYFKISWRNLRKNLGYSFINIGGLAVGMTIAILIGLWIHDELNYDTYHARYDRIAQVMQNQTVNGQIFTMSAIPIPLGPELQKTYGDDFKYIVLSSWTGDHILSHGENKISRTGNFMDVDAPHILDLHMLKGTREAFKEPNSILLSASAAKALFGENDPVNELMRIDNRMDVKVAGVYEDLPFASSFNEILFVGPWEGYVTGTPWIRNARDNEQWGNNSFQLFTEISDNADMVAVSARIKDAKLKRVSEDDKRFKPEISLHPMRDWHLWSNWENGVKKGGQIEYVWLFGIVGVFVLLLACINFMNLSTARSEKRAKEVGIRKSIGSQRKQLVIQFLSESILIVVIAFAIAVVLTLLGIPSFNDLSQKRITFPFSNLPFWVISLLFILVTSLLAGSYPALYLSSFNAVKVLKGTFRTGRLAALPRQVLVVVQFTVSVVLIIATIIVYSQIQYTKNRPIGFDTNLLINIEIKSDDYRDKYDLLRHELKSAGAIEEMSLSSSPLTQVWSNNGGFQWEGKDPAVDGEFATTWVSPEFGKVVNWNIVEGRDFTGELSIDSTSVIVNETGVRFMNLKDPVGKLIQAGSDSTAEKFTIVGVVKDLLMESPYQNVKQALFFVQPEYASWIELKLSPTKSASQSLQIVEDVFRKHVPNVPLDYEFVDANHARKFANEERVGTLAAIFAGLAVFISCLGLFGLASFVAEQRTKEIGIRKVLGASIVSLWRMLSKDFVLLVFISCIVAIPIAYYSLRQWLLHFEYRTTIEWWYFSLPVLAAIVITMITVSFQAIRAAMLNPVNSLRSE